MIEYTYAIDFYHYIIKIRSVTAISAGALYHQNLLTQLKRVRFAFGELYKTLPEANKRLSQTLTF